MIRRPNVRALFAVVFGAASLLALAFAGSGNAALDVARFSVAPSTIQARAHPSLAVSIAFAGPQDEVKDLALHFPAGLSANPGAFPFCSRKLLLANLCPQSAKVGSITITGEAFGFQLDVGRTIYNVRPLASERLRLAVPIFGTFSQPGVAAELPVAVRPGDGGLDMVVSGLPSQAGGVRFRVSEVRFSLRGVARRRVKGRLRRKAFITNPSSCTPATSALELISRDAPAAPVMRTSSFTPTGCV